METWPINLRKYQVDENTPQKFAKISGGWEHGPEMILSIGLNEPNCTFTRISGLRKGDVWKNNLQILGQGYSKADTVMQTANVSNTSACAMKTSYGSGKFTMIVVWGRGYLGELPLWWFHRWKMRVMFGHRARRGSTVCGVIFCVLLLLCYVTETESRFCGSCNVRIILVC
jgi:hypothetical protein